MAETLHWIPTEPLDALLARVAPILAAGGLVALPGDSGYELLGSAQHPAAVQTLMHLRETAAPGLLTSEWDLGFVGAAEAAQALPALSPLERRLLRRCWPGPFRLLFEPERQSAWTASLPDSTRGLIARAPFSGLRSPAHDVILSVMHQLAAPVLLNRVVAPQSLESGARAVEEMVAQFGANVALLITDPALVAPCELTVARVTQEKCELLHEGTLTAEQLQQQTLCVILFVCTGNTCRSPLAEAVCKKLLADRLGCTPSELVDRGYLVLSAGLAAYRGDPATPEAVEVAQEFGADLGAHLSKRLDPALAAQADYLLCMTTSHLQAVEYLLPHLAAVPRLLSSEGLDIADPIGQDMSVYRECAQQIAQHVQRFLDEMVPGEKR